MRTLPTPCRFSATSQLRAAPWLVLVAFGLGPLAPAALAASPARFETAPGPAPAAPITGSAQITAAAVTAAAAGTAAPLPSPVAAVADTADSPATAAAITASATTTDTPATSDPATGLSLALPPLQQAVGRPPAVGGPQEQTDLAILRWLQRYRTPEMVAAAWLLLDRNPHLFSRALGLDMAKSTPRISRGLKAFLALVDGAGRTIKLQAARPRPYISHADLHPCLPPESGYSFPSGHATWYAAAATLLADLVPDQSPRLLQVGDHGGGSRVLCGVHYPSDVEAGVRLGRAAAQQIIASTAWRRFRSDPEVLRELALIAQVGPQSRPLLVR